MKKLDKKLHDRIEEILMRDDRTKDGEVDLVHVEHDIFELEELFDQTLKEVVGRKDSEWTRGLYAKYRNQLRSEILKKYNQLKK